MDLTIDPDVKAVAEFMQQTIATSKLVSVATVVADIAPLLWGQFQPEPVEALQLVPAPIPACARRTRPCASG